jgi:hypothetical protein
MHVRWLLMLAVLGAAACGGGGAEPPRATTTPKYDPATGKLTELAYDATANGRTDAWADMDGTRVLRSRVDRDEDGKIDRWEYYDDQQRLVKVGFSRAGDGIADAWAIPAADGTVERIEISSSRDETKIDRIEYYEHADPQPGSSGMLVRAEVDGDGDGQFDRWETYAAGHLRSVAYDE